MRTEPALIDAEVARMAMDAFVHFGIAPARLDPGDCFAYALAKSREHRCFGHKHQNPEHDARAVAFGAFAALR